MSDPEQWSRRPSSPSKERPPSPVERSLHSGEQRLPSPADRSLHPAEQRPRRSSYSADRSLHPAECNCLTAAALWLLGAVLLERLAGCHSAAGRLYTEKDPLLVLDSHSLEPAVRNSPSACLLQFYSSWCGHCVQFSSTWKQLAQDVQDWDQAIRVAVLDCAQEENFDICKEYGVTFYPTFRYFRAHGPPADLGTTYRAADRDVQTLRQLMINVLQNHTKHNWPEGCPPLEPYSSAELLPLLGQRSVHYTAVIVEEPESYVGREVILDLSQYTGVVVRRALSTDRALQDKLGTAAFPSVYLLHPNTTHTQLHVQKRLRFFFSSFLRVLPGVQRKRVQISSSSHTGEPVPSMPWREFDSSKLYMVDLESALHYLLRVEMATHNALQGDELKTFRNFITVVTKLYPGRTCVQKLLQTVSDWLFSLPVETIGSIPYQAVLDLLDNKMMIPDMFLGSDLRWVGCQGSRAGLRGYPCALWTLFHLLSVQYDAAPHALANTALDGDPAAVLQAVHGYVTSFFGCRQCGAHFEQMAAESLDQVKTTEEAVIWLWSKHNLVNTRLAGSLSEDPLFPKSSWPGPVLCPSCHEEQDGVHIWNQEEVLVFLRGHYGAANLSPQYLPAPPSHDLQGALQAEKESPGEEQGGDKTQDGVHTPSGSGAWTLGFTSVDMSLCLVLYVFSCLLLMMLFFFFRIRSRTWKLKHNRLQV